MLQLQKPHLFLNKVGLILLSQYSPVTNAGARYNTLLNQLKLKALIPTWKANANLLANIIEGIAYRKSVARPHNNSLERTQPRRAIMDEVEMQRRSPRSH